MKKPNPGKQENDSKPQKDAPEGYPLYPAKDDIYKREWEDKDVDPEDGSRIKSEEEDNSDFEDDEDLLSDEEEGIEEGDLDVPGSELDDDMEDLGDEDEENNYYSIGGDKHADLDENNETEDDII